MGCVTGKSQILPATVRSRRTISAAGKVYIDGYLAAYKVMASKQRERLIEEILRNSKALGDDFGQAEWDASLVGVRLGNQLKVQNKAAKLAASGNGAEERTNVEDV